MAPTTECVHDVPVQIVIQNLHCPCLQPPWGLLRNRDEHRGVGLAEDEAFFALPLKLMPRGMQVHEGSKRKRTP